MRASTEMIVGWSLTDLADVRSSERNVSNLRDWGTWQLELCWLLCEISVETMDILQLWNDMIRSGKMQNSQTDITTTVSRSHVRTYENISLLITRTLLLTRLYTCFTISLSYSESKVLLVREWRFLTDMHVAHTARCSNDVSIHMIHRVHMAHMVRYTWYIYVVVRE